MSCLHRHLIFPTTVRKTSLKAVMLPVAQATLALNLSLGRKAWILRREQKSTQTQGLPKKINKPLKLKLSSPCATWAAPHSPETPGSPAQQEQPLQMPSSNKVLHCFPRTHFPECNATHGHTDFPALFFNHLPSCPLNFLSVCCPTG